MQLEHDGVLVDLPPGWEVRARTQPPSSPGRRGNVLLHAATVAIVGEVPIARLWHAVPSYPTISEVWLRLLEAYRG